MRCHRLGQSEKHYHIFRAWIWRRTRCLHSRRRHLREGKPSQLSLSTRQHYWRSTQPSTSFWADDEPDRYHLVDVNLHPIKLTRIAMQASLKKNKKGVIVMVSSAAALYPLYPTPLYNATKAALLAFTKSLRPADNEEGIKVVSICPGYVEIFGRIPNSPHHSMRAFICDENSLRFELTFVE